MKGHGLNLFFTIIFIVFIGATAQASDLDDPKDKLIKVQFSFNADSNIENRVDSYIKRELRSLGDIVIVEQNGDWELDIIVMEATTKGGYKSGIVVSVAILNKILRGSIWDLIEPDEKDDNPNRTKINITDHWLRIGPEETLKSICEKIVADFDTMHLEPFRKYNKQL